MQLAASSKNPAIDALKEKCSGGVCAAWLRRSWFYFSILFIYIYRNCFWTHLLKGNRSEFCQPKDFEPGSVGLIMKKSLRLRIQWT